jgi:hypothetical protein
MYFKRPSFRRGGSTGIAQLSSNRQMYAGGGNIGGGIFTGSNLGSRTGFQTINPAFVNLGGGQPVKPELTKMDKAKNILKRGTSLFKNPNPGSSNPFFINQLKNLYSKVPKTTGIFNVLRTGAAAAPVTATLAIPAATTFGLMQLNKAKTVEALEYMKSMNQSGVFDETASPEDYEEYTKVFNYLNENGTPISFTENFASDETLEKIKDEGRTKISSDMDAAAAKKAMTTDRAYNMDEIVDSVVTDKDKKTTDEPEEKEKSFEDIYQTEFDRIQKLIGDDDSKGMAAIALSEAIGTPGTIADKAAVLNKSLAQIMAGKKKDKKDIAKLAYSATKEIEKAKIAAGKTSDSQKNFERIQNLTAIINDNTGTYSDTQKKSARAQLEIIKESIKILNPSKTDGSLTGVSAAGGYIDDLSKLAKKINKQEKGSAKYNELLAQYMALRNFLLGINNNALNSGVATTDAIIGLDTKKDGGRIKLAKGTPIEESVEVSETVGQGETPTAQVQKLSYAELRNRLPQEITDDVIRLIANSNEALTDFAYIRTQGDVVKFNTKYGVNLVLPAQTA